MPLEVSTLVSTTPWLVRIEHTYICKDINQKMQNIAGTNTADPCSNHIPLPSSQHSHNPHPNRAHDAHPRHHRRGRIPTCTQHADTRGEA